MTKWLSVSFTLFILLGGNNLVDPQTGKHHGIFVPPPAQFLSNAQDTSIFDITFIDFPEGGAEKAAVEYAAAIWSSLHGDH